MAKTLWRRGMANSAIWGYAPVPTNTHILSQPQSEKKWKFSNSVVSDSLWPHVCPQNFPGKSTGVVAISSSRGSSPPRDQTWVSCIAGRLYINWATWLDHGPKPSVNLPIHAALNWWCPGKGRDGGIHAMGQRRVIRLPRGSPQEYWSASEKEKSNSKSGKQEAATSACETGLASHQYNVEDIGQSDG